MLKKHVLTDRYRHKWSIEVIESKKYMFLNILTFNFRKLKQVRRNRIRFEKLGYP